MADPNALSFEGSDPKEFEEFVSAVRRRALEQGKNRDNEWMADFAASCFSGDAFYWYEDLDEDVQNDWSRLRPALVARFGRRGLISPLVPSAPTIPDSAPFTTMPTPAAAPPVITSLPTAKKGLLKALRVDGSLCGYLAKSSREGLHEHLSADPKAALLVSFVVPPMGESFEIQIIDSVPPHQTLDVLALCWKWLKGDDWLIDHDNVAMSCSLSTVASNVNSQWRTEKKVWKISNDGELCVEYPKQSGGSERLQAHIYQSSNEFYWMRSSRRNTRYKPVRVFVEGAM